ncbi:hypothetical protein FIBSPDRAFT_713265, partial [Athelia psychrophila]
DTILSTAQETWEEMGLVTKRIVGTFQGFERESGKGLTLQINFLVEVDWGAVKINPEEHQALACEAQGCNLGKSEGSMRGVVSD